MGLLSVHGKQEADRLKLVNRRASRRSTPRCSGSRWASPRSCCPRPRAPERVRWRGSSPLVGLNTGAGGRWVGKQLPVDRTVELAGAISRERQGKVRFLVLGGQAEAERNRAIVAGLRAHPDKPAFIDAGTDHALLDFAARVELCTLLVTSDSLALHMAVALERRIVAFFAPTSAAEIELYGLGEKVLSTAPDYGSYRPDADNSTLTVERLLPACLRQL